MTDTLIFLDTETTGLGASARVTELGLLPVDRNLQPIDPGVSWIVRTEPEVLAHMNDTVRDMHTANGLLAELEAGNGLDILEVTRQAVAYLNQFGQPGQIPMAGSSIHFDRKMIIRTAPKIESWFHYRNVDVSTVKELWRRWYPEAGEPPKNGGHRALADCYDSVAELQWYKDRIQLTAEAWLNSVG